MKMRPIMILLIPPLIILILDGKQLKIIMPFEQILKRVSEYGERGAYAKIY